MTLDASTILNAVTAIVGCTGIVLGIRGKLETFRATVELELRQLRDTIAGSTQTIKAHDEKLSQHDRDLWSLKWRIGMGGNGSNDPPRPS